MILNDLFESRMSDLDIEYQDYKNMKPVAFYSRYKMTPDEWASKNWSLIKGSETVHEGAMKDLHTELAEKYRELAPKVEKYKDSYLAGQLYDALEAIAIEHGAELELKRMMTGARNRAHMDYDTNPGGFQNWFWYLPFADEQLDEISKTTLASYVKKAAPDRYNRIPNDLMQMKDAEKNRRQWVTRDKGIAQALDKLSKEGVTEESQDDRNARIIAGEIEDAAAQGNDQLVKQKIKELKKLGYYFDKQGRLQRMGMYEADTMSASGRARQQASRYNVDSETYRAQPMPSVGPKDITQKFQQVPRVSHQDLVTRQSDLDDPIEKTELNIDRQRLQQLIKSQIKTLKPIEQEILIDRFWHDLSYAKIGKRLNLSVERIRQIEAKTLRKLRHPSRSADTKPFLDPDYVKPKTPTPVKSIVDPALAYKTGYNDAMSGQQHRFKTAYMSSNEPYDAGYEAGKRKKQTFNLDRVSDMAEEQLDEKQDACYHKVKSRYKVWPSAYASGALVQCRKKGAANWGNKSKK
jgi:RNA polymerase sigma factor (sigma-70 family)